MSLDQRDKCEIIWCAWVQSSASVKIKLYPNFLLMVCILFYFKSTFSSHNWKWDQKFLYLGFGKISHELELDTVAKVRIHTLTHQFFDGCVIIILTSDHQAISLLCWPFDSMLTYPSCCYNIGITFIISHSILWQQLSYFEVNIQYVASIVVADNMSGLRKVSFIIFLQMFYLVLLVWLYWKVTTSIQQ